MSKRYFVTGTGTGVGKTFVTCAIAKLACDRGLNVIAHKPIETGCLVVDGDLTGEDQRLLHLASSPWLFELNDDEVEFGTYQLGPALAPAVAAALSGTSIDLERIRATLGRCRTPSGGQLDLLLVEGAGGWRVPLTEQHDMSELARMVGGDVIVVGTAGLGTINHSLLTLEAIERDGLNVAALVLSNRPDDREEKVRRNVVEIRKRWSGRVLLVNDLEHLL